MTSPNPDGGDAAAASRPPAVIALLGNPNVGKTTLFNRLCAERHQTANFAGTTQSARIGALSLGGGAARLVDLPGIYDLAADRHESKVCRDALAGRIATGDLGARRPDVVLVVADATNLDRSLLLASEARADGHAVVIALNMIDEATREGIEIDAARLGEGLGCVAIKTCGRDGLGVDELAAGLARAIASGGTVEPAAGPVDHRAKIAEAVAASVSHDQAARDRAERAARRTDRIDDVLTHPVIGFVVFAAVMTGLFAVIFKLATYPMDWLDGGFGDLAAWASTRLPEGLIADFIADGVIAGVGGTVVFLPQICLLFALLRLLEDSGYLPRAALVADRLMRPFGLSGHSFVPLLSAHACALPAIAAARGIPDERERLATILVAPFMSCTARIPVYVLLTGLLFPGKPVAQAIAFTGCYVLGAAAALLVSAVVRRTLSRGDRRPTSLELPNYRLPSIKAAGLAMWDRGLGFLRKAGTVILLISIVLWWLNAFPGAEPTAEAEDLRAQAATIVETDAEQAAALESEADSLDASEAARTNFLARIGGTVEPVFAPLGYDRSLTIGVLASFAAREVFVTTMAVQAAGDEELEDQSLLDAIANATRDDGTPVFTLATSWSLLVFYVLAMQCLPTVVLTAREAGGVRFGLLQLAGMTAIAWVAAFAAYRIALAAGLG